MHVSRSTLDLMVKAKKKTNPEGKPKGKVSVPRLKSVLDSTAAALVGGKDTDLMDSDERQKSKVRNKHSKVKRSLVRKKRRVKVLGAKHKQKRTHYLPSQASQKILVL